MEHLRAIAYQRRLEVLELVYRHKAGHIGGSMSCMDMLVSLYYDVMRPENGDRFLLSKGHCAEALYTVLADTGYIEKSELDSYTAFGTRLAGHPTPGIPGVAFATGALGHGLPLAVGMALGMKRDKAGGRVFVLTGDGELAEGSNWEAMMAAAKYGLDNLALMIDRNRLEISGGTEEIMPLEDLAGKLRAFGFSVTACDGHDPAALHGALSARGDGRPAAVIADTVKGCGSPVMENKAGWHHHTPTDEEYRQIRRDLTARLMEARHD